VLVHRRFAESIARFPRELRERISELGALVLLDRARIFGTRLACVIQPPHNLN